MDVAVKLRIRNRAGEAFLGPGPVELLKRIRDGGSIHRAAREMEMSYMKALRLINEVEANVVGPLVTRRTGGTRGGGTQLTPLAEGLIDAFERFQSKVLSFAGREFERALARKIGKGKRRGSL